MTRVAATKSLRRLLSERTSFAVGAATRAHAAHTVTCREAGLAGPLHVVAS